MAIGLKRSLALWAGVLLLLRMSLPVAAHNGAVAIAVPMAGIAIDGELSDWPQEARAYPVARILNGAPPREAQDCRAAFRIGYNTAESALYVAVEVQDESTFLESEYGWVRDGCELYFDLEHGVGSSSVFQPVIWGEEKKVVRNGTEVIPKSFDLGIRRTGGSTWYEWCVDLAALYEKSLILDPGTMLGFDVVVNDRDRDGTYTRLAWGSGAAKHTPGDAWNRGDVALVATGATGRVAGQVRWEGQEGSGGSGVTRIRLKSLARPEMWVQVRTDSQGMYEAELPVGKYQVETGYRRRITVAEEVEVKAAETAPVGAISLARPPLGLQVPAGPGATVVCPPPKLRPAGSGFRRQSFRTYTPVDGLPTTLVESLYQDRAGNLWIGTEGGGVTRFDGATFATLTQEHGLSGSDVRAMAEDHQGALWFSTVMPRTPGTEGLCRYDGARMTRFDTTDGLVTTTVYGMDVDAAGALWLATPKGAVRYDGRSFTTFTQEDGLVSDAQHSVLVDRRGHVWLGSEGPGVSRFDGQGFTAYDPSDGLGLASGPITRIYQDREGNIWFLDQWAGATCYDGKRFIAYGQPRDRNGYMDMAQDADGQIWFVTDGGDAYRMEGTRFIRVGAEAGLPNRFAFAVLAGKGGGLWFGTGAGLSRYCGDQLQVFTATDFAGASKVRDMAEDRAHHLWLATDLGLTRYDGQEFTHFTPAIWPDVPDNLDSLSCVLVSQDGSIWMGGLYGLFRFDGQRFTRYTTEDGLAGNRVSALAQDQDGALWVASWEQGVARQKGVGFEVVNARLSLPARHVNVILPAHAGGVWIGSSEGSPGLFHYDGTQFVNHTPSRYRAAWVSALAENAAGTLWIGTWGAGVGRYDGREFTYRGAQEGVTSNLITSLLVDRRGAWWAGTAGGGVTVSDGTVFQNLTVRDGLPDDNIQTLYQDHTGAIWIATAGGLCRYRPQNRAPEAMVTGVITDRPLGPVSEVMLPSSQKYLRVEYRVRGLEVVPGRTVYLYRLVGRDMEWHSTREERVEYGDLPVGKYELQLRAVDQDLNYSDTSTVKIEVAFPYLEVGRWVGAATACLVAAAALVYGTRRRRDQRRAEQALMRDMAEELQTAHDLQMGLMPREAPRIAGFEIAGRCLPANHVGGDFFQYFPRNGKLSLCLADVTGHAMEAAIPVVMFNGILESQMEQGGRLEELFSRLTRSLHRTRVSKRTYVCFTMGEVDVSTRTLRLANGGCPYPCHFRAATGDVAELPVEAYPLGVHPDTVYATIEVSLSPGDRVVFCSDGIAEAADGQEELFGFARTVETIRQACVEDLSAEALIDRLIGTVKAFAGDTPQGDDMTVVVLKVET